MQRDTISAMLLRQGAVKHAVVHSTRDSIVYFTKDDGKNLPSGQGTPSWQAYSTEEQHGVPTCVLETGEESGEKPDRAYRTECIRYIFHNRQQFV